MRDILYRNAVLGNSVISRFPYQRNITCIRSLQTPGQKSRYRIPTNCDTPVSSFQWIRGLSGCEHCKEEKGKQKGKDELNESNEMLIVMMMINERKF